MKEVLLPIGTIVTADVAGGDKGNRYMIIGQRQYNPHSSKSWDYLAVPYPLGYEQNNKAEKPFSNNNMCYFNHTDIYGILLRHELLEGLEDEK